MTDSQLDKLGVRPAVELLDELKAIHRGI